MLCYILDVQISDDSTVIITLDTGASYTVSPDDLVTVSAWSGQRVKLMPARTKNFPVRLQHADTGEAIKVRRLVQQNGGSEQ